MERKYLELMEKVLTAYTTEHIVDYFERVKTEGLTEHGFPRLTSDIGILIANGRKTELTDLFCEMMEFCCKTIPTVKAANDFSVREVVCCLAELEKNNAIAAADIARWKEYLSTIEPEKCYDVYAKAPTDPVRNWALFTGVSEYYRLKMGLCDTMEFIETQIASQLQWLDENGMYMDNGEAPIHQPMVYDIVPRGLFSLLLFAGYKGKYYDIIDASLKKAGLYTLNMQSVTGELPFGGRSNQFLHNEAWLAAICEYEAVRYRKEGDDAMAGKFKAAAKRALENIEYWLSKTPISHVKNRFPFAVHHGCEAYAYFDKYMTTAASFLYAGYMFCDDSIETAALDASPMVWRTSEHFHKVFARAGEYFLEFDTNGDSHYDASGLGRVHRKDAPSTICLSLPAPSHPRYRTGVKEHNPMSLCPGIKQNGEWKFGTDADCTYEMTDSACTDDSVTVTFNCRFGEDGCVSAEHTMNKDCVTIYVKGDVEIAYMLPAFSFDGVSETEITADDTHLTITYEGWQCRYTTTGTITDTEKRAGNRSGYYRIFQATAQNTLTVKIEILKK